MRRFAGGRAQSSLRGRESLCDRHRTSTPRARPDRSRGICKRRRNSGLRFGGGQEREAERQQRCPSPVGKESEVPDANEAVRQDVQRRAHRFFLPEPFPGKPVLSIEDPVIGRVDDDRVVLQFQVAQGGAHGSDHVIVGGDQPVVPQHGSLIQLGRPESHAPATAVFGMVKRQRKASDIVGARAARLWHRYSGVPRFRIRRREVLPRIFVLHVRRFESYGQAERPVLGCAADELVGLVPHHMVQVRAVGPLREIKPLARKAPPHIERTLGHLAAHAELADNPVW